MKRLPVMPQNEREAEMCRILCDDFLERLRDLKRTHYLGLAIMWLGGFGIGVFACHNGWF